MKKMLFILVILILAGSGYLLIQHEASDTNPFTNPSKTGEEDESGASLGRKPGIPLEVNGQFNATEFAEDLGRARDLEFSPGGTLLVSNPLGDVYALPDRNNDGVADGVKTIISGGNKPHGLAFYEGKLYVAEVNRVTRYNWNEESLEAIRDKVLFSLPGGGNHSSRTIVFDRKGTMFVSIGSTCNVCFEAHEWIAAVIASDKDGNNPRLYSKGLRNAPFLTLHPARDEIWVTEMGRDFLGDNLPPDEINILRDKGDFGWPVCYGTKVYDKNFNQRSQAYCRNTIAPIFEIPAHSAPLGLTFINSSQFPSDWQGDLLVAYHGSWNRSTPTGYKIVRMSVDGDTIIRAEDFLTGFIDGKTVAGRPVDVIFDKKGALYVSDDNRGVVYKIAKN